MTYKIKPWMLARTVADTAAWRSTFSTFGFCVQRPETPEDPPNPMTRLLHYLFPAFSIALSLALVGCGAASDSNDAGSTGTLEIHLTDHREAIGDFARLDVEIDTVRHHRHLARRVADRTL